MQTSKKSIGRVLPKLKENDKKQQILTQKKRDLPKNHLI
jgi:hypothetical protein